MLGRVIIVRIRYALDNKLRKEQAGFRRGKGCMQQIKIFRTITDKNDQDILQHDLNILEKKVDYW